jgi:glutamate-1-semialdehyde 2,1-aminomutase
MPGGVSSPVRAYHAVDRCPVFIAQGSGCRVTDLDGNTYIDYVGSYGPLILGHAPEPVTAALTKTIRKGTSFGMPTRAETKLAKCIADALPGHDLVRFVNSGTEAAMSALRLARAATGRAKIIKCTGCYHGHFDGLLVEAGSGAATLGTPSSPGVPASVAGDTVLVPFNDLDAVGRAMTDHAGQIACMAVEPVAGNMGVIPPADGYLQGLRELCDEHDVLLLFDEVMTGFRVAWGGAQVKYGVKPDLTCLGKVIGGGLPCAAYAGPEKLMRQISPDGPVYQAGTLSGNPLAMAAGQATLDALYADDKAAYTTLDTSSAKLAQGLRKAAKDADCPVTITRVGSMLCVFFTDQPDQPPRNYDDVAACSPKRFAAFFNAMLERGVILPPSMYEAWFVGAAHDAEAVEVTVTAAASAFAEAKTA